MAPWFTKIYRPEDKGLEKRIIDEGNEQECESFFPILPMHLVNGVIGIGTGDKDEDSLSRAVLQERCWIKAQRNPHINTTVKRYSGRLAGNGFETTSDIPQITKTIKEIEYDQRNRLYLYYQKWVIRSTIEGELFLCFTCHADGFIAASIARMAGLKGEKQPVYAKATTRPCFRRFFMQKAGLYLYSSNCDEGCALRGAVR